MSKVLETTRQVVEKSESVKINQDKVAEFSANFQNRNLSHWLSSSPIAYSHLEENDTLNFLLVFNSSSFCYWGNPKWTIEYKGQQYDGSWGMVAAIVRAIDDGLPILDAKYRAQISKEDYQRMMRGNVEIPLLNERWNIMRAVASTLVDKYGGDFANMIRAANKDGSELLDLVVASFPSFDDTSEYEDKTIYFYKRAQLLVEDLYQTFGGEGFGELDNLEEFTACADYKLPQSLRKLGILSYDAELANKVDTLVEIPRGSVEEVEIRANTIWAVEAIKSELTKIGKKVSSIGINDHLWLMGQVKSSDDKPYHRTLTTAY